MTDEHAARPTLQALYCEQFAFVWRSLRRLGVAEAVLDDAIHDVFLVVHRRLAEFAAGAAPRPWLFGIALRVARQHRRKHWRERVGLGFGLAERVPQAQEPDPFQAAQRAQSVRALQRVLDALDEDKRCVFMLADLEEMSGPEVAQALGLNLNTVYARLRAARKQVTEAVRRERARARREGDG